MLNWFLSLFSKSTNTLTSTTSSSTEPTEQMHVWSNLSGRIETKIIKINSEFIFKDLIFEGYYSLFFHYHSEATNEITISADSTLINKIAVDQRDDCLKVISSKRASINPPQIHISLNNLYAMDLNIKLKGDIQFQFNGHKNLFIKSLFFQFNGSHDCHLNEIYSQELSILANDATWLRASGNTNELTTHASNNAKIDLVNLPTQTANIHGCDSSETFIMAQDKIFLHLDHFAQLRFAGDPVLFRQSISPDSKAHPVNAKARF